MAPSMPEDVSKELERAFSAINSELDEAESALGGGMGAAPARSVLSRPEPVQAAPPPAPAPPAAAERPSAPEEPRPAGEAGSLKAENETLKARLVALAKEVVAAQIAAGEAEKSARAAAERAAKSEKAAPAPVPAGEVSPARVAQLEASEAAANSRASILEKSEAQWREKSAELERQLAEAKAAAAAAAAAAPPAGGGPTPPEAAARTAELEASEAALKAKVAELEAALVQARAAAAGPAVPATAPDDSPERQRWEQEWLGRLETMAARVTAAEKERDEAQFKLDEVTEAGTAPAHGSADNRTAAEREALQRASMAKWELARVRKQWQEKYDALTAEVAKIQEELKKTRGGR